MEISRLCFDAFVVCVHNVPSQSSIETNQLETETERQKGKGFLALFPTA
jgi:hypothetical protein